MAGFGAGCGWARCGRAGVRLLADETGEARPLTAQRQIMYPGQSASQSSHNADATPHTGTIARWRMADPPMSSHVSRVARILRHTQPAEHHRKKPKPAGICGDTHADTYATCGRPTVTIRNSPDTATCVCHDIHNPSNTAGSNARPPTSNRPRMPRHTPTNASNARTHDHATGNHPADNHANTRPSPPQQLPRNPLWAERHADLTIPYRPIK